ncbi:endonuclease/exonuclease/phosphatase family protein [Gelidibacter salicanalis]|uniref:Endonuclease/exonuclease/phosphatase family protein n=1 Tax=Gelidibacter salicanalis TaxID=291193 RepID=A0A934NJN5_9FLAO|nr:endonuclease/exonuclease/phosphatase family protein [Gelidibacter salicanalis]MBJ7882913.1 endonuclease/exonuclease/phosphatase family protein [Gelidibacter salicanalis]
MATILDAPPDDIQMNINLLNKDLDAHLPFKEIDRNLLIATWNIRAFGNYTRKWKSEEEDSPKRDMHSILCIAAIIKRFDVIAVQEVKANIRGLRDVMKLLGSHWSLILTDVTKGSSGNGERMAFIFDTRRVNLSGLACELVVPKERLKGDISKDALEEQFVRTPYAVSFKSCSQTFILVTLHIKYGKKSSERIRELKGIAQWLSDWAGDMNAYHQNLITLGDFNIDARGDLLDKTFLSEGLYVPDALQDPLITRSIFNETKYYDQIAWFNNNSNVPNLSLDFLGAGNFDFLSIALRNRNLSKRSISYMLSDHYPLWAEFRIA